VAVYGLAIVAFFVTSRYRLPVVPLLLVLASSTLLELATLVRRQQWHTVARVGGIAVAVLLVTATDWAGAHRPDPADRHFSLGNRHFAAGDMESAIAAYERALAATSGVTTEVQLQALNNIASARLNQGRSREAREAARRSLRIRSSPEGLARLGWAYFQEARYDSARAALRRSIAMNASNAEALYYLGHVQRVDGDLQAALATWERALAAHPEPGLEQLLCYALATFHVEAGQHPERALRYLDRITRPFPDLDRLRAAATAAREERRPDGASGR
jgi:tetratricopeptide (TPR) repeat protein